MTRTRRGPWSSGPVDTAEAAQVAPVLADVLGYAGVVRLHTGHTAVRPGGADTRRPCAPRGVAARRAGRDCVRARRRAGRPRGADHGGLGCSPPERPGGPPAGWGEHPLIALAEDRARQGLRSGLTPQALAEAEEAGRRIPFAAVDDVTALALAPVINLREAAARHAEGR